MADSILRLKVESQEYDAKLKRAAQGLQQYADGCRKVGGTLEVVEKETLDFVRAIGQMETTAKGANSSLGEMKKTFTDLSVVYNKLTDAEKQSPFGQALKGSLDELKGRIQSSNQEIKQINDSINGGGGLTGALDNLAGKLGLNIGELTKFGSVAGVATTALKVAKDAFFQSEQNIDEWGRTLKGAENAYDVFLQTLNNGNWSQFFQNLETAIRGGRDLYDLYDRLGSIKANNSVAIAMTQAEIQNLRLLKQQGQDVDDKIKAATQRLAQLQGQGTQAGIAAGKGQVVNTLRNGVNSIGGARINDATLGYVAEQIAKGGQAYFDYMKRRADALEQKGMVTLTQTINDSQGGTYERQYRVFDINQLSREQQKQYNIAKTVTERETEIQKGLATWSQSVREQASNSREIFRDNRYSLTGGGGGKGGSGSGGGVTINMDEKIQAAFDTAMLKAAANISGMKPTEDAGPSAAFDVYKQFYESQQKNTDELKSLTEALGVLNESEGLSKNGTGEKKTEIKNRDGMADLSKAMSGLSSITSGLKSMGFDLGSDVEQAIGVIQGLMSVIQGVNTIISIFSNTAMTANTAAIVANTAALTTNSVISGIPFFARGGIVHAATGWVGGNNMSGDMVPAMLNSGELVLNRAQQGNLASQLSEQGGGGGVHIAGILKGEDIVLMADRWGKRTGRGELLFAKNL